jgi:hypothetical protein
MSGVTSALTCGRRCRLAMSVKRNSYSGAFDAGMQRLLLQAGQRGGHQRRGHRGHPRMPGQPLDLRDLPPPAEILDESARVTGAAGNLGQRAGPGQHRVDRGGGGRDLLRAEDLPDAYHAIAGEGRHGLFTSKHRLHGRTLARALRAPRTSQHARCPRRR